MERSRKCQSHLHAVVRREVGTRPTSQSRSAGQKPASPDLQQSKDKNKIKKLWCLRVGVACRCRGVGMDFSQGREAWEWLQLHWFGLVESNGWDLVIDGSTAGGWELLA